VRVHELRHEWNHNRSCNNTDRTGCGC